MDNLAKAALITFNLTSSATKIDTLLSEIIAVIQNIDCFTDCNLSSTSLHLPTICEMLQTVKFEGKRGFPYNNTLVSFGDKFQAENYLKEPRMLYQIRSCLDKTYYDDHICNLVPKDITQENLTFLQTHKPCDWSKNKNELQSLLFIIQQYLQNITNGTFKTPKETFVRHREYRRLRYRTRYHK